MSRAEVARNIRSAVVYDPLSSPPTYGALKDTPSFRPYPRVLRYPARVVSEIIAYCCPDTKLVI
jgi:hypothetical protein